MNSYIVISGTPDGAYMNVYTEEQLTQKLNDGHFGEHPVFCDAPPRRYAGSLRENGVQYFIIKGEFVLPKEEKVVTEWKL